MLAFIHLLDLSVQDVVANLPRDGGAVITFILFALFVGFIWVGSRPKTNGSQRKKQTS